MDKTAIVHWIVDVDWVRKLALIDRMDGDQDQDQAQDQDQDQAQEIKTRQHFSSDRDQGQSRCPENTAETLKLRIT